MRPARPRRSRPGRDSWNGWWTVFIWCWVIAFSPFVAGFIARISRGRTLREFVIGVTIVPSLIVMIWIGVIGSAAIYYDDLGGRAISAAVGSGDLQRAVRDAGRDAVHCR